MVTARAAGPVRPRSSRRQPRAFWFPLIVLALPAASTATGSADAGGDADAMIEDADSVTICPRDQYGRMMACTSFMQSLHMLSWKAPPPTDVHDLELAADESHASAADAAKAGPNGAHDAGHTSNGAATVANAPARPHAPHGLELAVGKSHVSAADVDRAGGPTGRHDGDGHAGHSGITAADVRGREHGTHGPALAVDRSHATPADAGAAGPNGAHEGVEHTSDSDITVGSVLAQKQVRSKQAAAAEVGGGALLQGGHFLVDVVTSLELGVLRDIMARREFPMKVTLTALAMAAIAAIAAGLYYFTSVAACLSNPANYDERVPAPPRCNDLPPVPPHRAPMGGLLNITDIPIVTLGASVPGYAPTATFGAGAPDPRRRPPQGTAPADFAHPGLHTLHQPPSLPVARPPHSRILCPELVVPKRCECVLVIPTHSLSEGHLHIKDLKGNTVLRVSRRRPGGGKHVAEGDIGPQLVITTAKGNVVSQCYLVRREGIKEFRLFDAANNHFATLVNDLTGQCTTLNTVTGSKYDFTGSFDTRTVNVMDHEGKYCASTEPCARSYDASSEHYRLRAAPLTDVGLLLCSLLCIDHLA